MLAVAGRPAAAPPLGTGWTLLLCMGAALSPFGASASRPLVIVAVGAGWSDASGGLADSD